MINPGWIRVEGSQPPAFILLYGAKHILIVIILTELLPMFCALSDLHQIVTRLCSVPTALTFGVVVQLHA